MDKNILIVSAVYPPEPVVSARLSEDLYESLKKRGQKVKVFHPRPTRPNGFDFGEEIKVGVDEIVADSYTCAKSSLWGRVWESYSFGKATKSFIEQQHGMISSIYANTWPLFAQKYLAKTAKKYGIPYIIHIQDIYPESFCYKMPNVFGKIAKWLMLPMDKYLLRNAAKIVGISPAMISYLSKSRQVDDSRFSLVRNWQDDSVFVAAHEGMTPGGGVFHVMYLGSISPTANVPLIIEAASKLDRKSFKLSVIGNGPDKEHCQVVAANYGLDVVFDVVTPEQVADKQKEADALVLCLKKGVANTATPSKLTSYMLSGRPVIASVDLDSDCANIIREARCGIVVEPGREDTLRDAIEEMAGYEAEELEELGKNAFEYAMKNLSQKKNLGVLTDIILNTVEN